MRSSWREAGQLLILKQVLALAQAVEHALGNRRVEQVLPAPTADGRGGPERRSVRDQRGR